MTRSTEVIITSPGIDRHELWAKCAALINAPEQYRFEVTSKGIHAHIDQGLCALLDVRHAVGGGLVPAEECDPEWPCAEPCDGWLHDPAHYLMVDFDTAYAHVQPCGCHSGGLHLRLVYELGLWLTERGASWEWFDESGDCWNHGPDWGTLGDPREACPLHRSLPAPPAQKRVTSGA
jgi:hypothetical protein